MLGFRRMRVLSVRFEDNALVVGVAVRGRSRCSRCGRKCRHYDRLKTRRWRDLDVGPFRIYLEGRLHRVRCRRCGVAVEATTWAEARSGFTRRFEEWVTWLVQRCDKTMVSTLARIAWRTVGVIVERTVSRHRQPVDYGKLRAIGVDELSYRKGHRYLTLVTDLEAGRIIWSKEGRSAATLAAFFEEIGPEARAGIRFAVIDMAEGYRKAIEEELPNAELAYDRFHVQQLLSQAMDKVRREEWRRLQGTAEGTAIKHTRWALLKRPWNVTPKEDEKLASLQQSNHRLYRGYLLKEAFAGIYDRRLLPGWAQRRIREWLSWASRSRLTPFVKAARTIRKHLDGIVAYFKHGYTNSRAEGLNTKARLATRQAYGFHTADAVRAMIDLRCSGLVIPLPHLP